MKTISIIDAKHHVNEKVKIGVWLTNKRSSGKIAFLPEKSGFHSESRLMYLFNFCCCRALVLFCLCFDLFQQFSIDTHCETRLILSGKWKNIAPHISFSLEREKETCRARYKEKENSERLSWRKVLLFRLCFMS